MSYSGKGALRKGCSAFTRHTEKEQAEWQGCRGVCHPTGYCCRFRNHLWSAFVKCLSLCGSFCACGDLPWEPKRGPGNLRSQGSPWGQSCAGAGLHELGVCTVVPDLSIPLQHKNPRRAAPSAAVNPPGWGRCQLRIRCPGSVRRFTHSQKVRAATAAQPLFCAATRENM